MAKASGVDRDLIVVANTMMDFAGIGGCSCLVVEPKRSKTGNLLFGRNCDTRPIGNLHEFSLVMVYRPQGKRPFAMIGFPGVIASDSAINAAGLAVGANEIRASADGARFDPSGVSTTVGFRRIIEECATVDEAERKIRAHKACGLSALTICDKRKGVVLEITPKNVAVRRAENGLCLCTNHFRTKELQVGKGGLEELFRFRYRTLEKESRNLPKLGVDDVSKQLHGVNQGAATIHSMVIDPASLRLHLSIGKPPASSGPFRVLELQPFFKAQ